MTFAAVLAGGIGSRMGAEMPKQYLEVGGKPILVRSVEQFACREDMACVLVLTPEDWVSYTRRCTGHGPDGRCHSERHAAQCHRLPRKALRTG